MKFAKLLSVLTSAAMLITLSPVHITAADMEMAHDPSRNVQEEGVGNPFNYGERNTPADASTEEIRKINHNMTVQEVKYAVYKEIDEHWDLLKVRLGETEREKVYALFLGLGTRESTLGGNGDGADIETAQQDGFGVNSAHAYGTFQTAVTAFADCNPLFMKEDNVPEMFQYSFTESNFYDAIISNHMGIRKILHFIEIELNEDGQKGYQVVRCALKGFNTGWSEYTGPDDGYFKGYPDEIMAMAHWYYDEGHLYDNVFTWTSADVVAPYRNDPWQWWSDCDPSMAPVSSKTDDPGVEQPTDPPKTKLLGDVNFDGVLDKEDIVRVRDNLLKRRIFDYKEFVTADINEDGSVNCIDLVILKNNVMSK